MLTVQPLLALESPDARPILVLASYHMTHDWTEQLTDTIRADCARMASAPRMEIYSFDMMRTRDPEAVARKLHQILERARGGRYSMIVTLDSPISRLLLEQSEVPPELPIVFAGWEDPPADLKTRHPNATGIIQSGNPVATVRDGLLLYPDTEEILVISDDSPESRHFESFCRQELPGRFPRLKFYFENNAEQGIDRIFQKVAALPEHALVMLSPWRGLYGSDYQSLAEFGTDLYRIGNKPYLVNCHGLFGYGALGGAIVDPVRHGHETSALIEKVLATGSAVDLPVRNGSVAPIYDWAMLESHHLDTASLPSQALLLNRPPSVWQTYQIEVMSGGGALLVLLSAGLFWGYASRRGLRRGCDVLRMLPGRVGVVNRQERILFLHSGDIPASKFADARFIKDISSDYNAVSRAVRDVFETGASQVLEYDCREGGRVMFLAPVSRSLFGEEAVIWFSHDNSALQEARAEVRQALMQLEAGTRITRSATFTFDRQTYEIHGSSMLAQLLPVENDHIRKLNHWIYPEDQPAVFDKWRQLYSGKIPSATFDYRRKINGEFFYYRLYSSCDPGDPSRRLFNGVVQDVTDLRRAFEQLQEQQYLWHSIIDSMPLLFFAKDPEDEFRYRLCNRAFAESVGLSTAEVIGKTDSELFHSAADVARFREWDRRVMTLPEGTRYEESFHDAQGELHHWQTIKKTFVGLDGRRLLLGVSSDISSLKCLLNSEQFNSEVLAVAATNEEFDLMMDHLAEVLRRRLDCDRVILGKSNSAGLPRLLREWLSPGIPSLAAVGLDECYVLWDKSIPLLCENQVLKVEDIATEPLFEELVRKKHYQARSLLVAPVFIGGELWGTLSVAFFRSRRKFTEIDERIIRTCSNVIAIAAMGAQQKQAIRRADQERQLILDNIHIPIWLHDKTGRLIRANSAVCDLLKVPAEALTTEKNRALLAGAFSDGEAQPIEVTLATGKSVCREIRLLDREYTITSEPVFDTAGQLAYIVKAAVDMTEFNKLLASRTAMTSCLESLIGEPDWNKALKQTLRSLCVYFGAARAFVSRFDAERKTMTALAEYAQDGREFFCEKVQDLPFSTRPDWQGRFQREQTIAVQDLSNAPIADFGDFWPELVRQYDMRSIYATRLLVQSRLWGDVGLIFSGEPRVLAAESIQFLQSFTHFIEVMLERRLSSDQLVRAMERAQNADRAKSFFIASVSHEIRTPLNAVIGFADLLRHGGVPAEQQGEYLESIAYSANALLQLINDVLDLSKLEADQMKIEPEATDFAALGSEVMAVFQYRAKEQGIVLRLEIPQLPMLELDRLRIRQILFNLIGNAVKFTPSGSVTLRANWAPSSDDHGELTFAVIDTGIGISQEDQAKLMEPFVQLSHLRGTNAGNSGTGLGLSISKRLVEKMDGRLWVKSTPFCGSEFGATLHQVKVAPYTAPVIRRESLSLPPAAKIELPVLIVDDVEMNLRVMKAICGRAGVSQVVTASTGSAALAELEKRRYGLVLTDLWMPDITGAELASRIHADPRFARLPVVAVTADVEAKDNFPMEDFAGILFKPVTLEKLREVIGAVTGQP